MRYRLFLRAVLLTPIALIIATGCTADEFEPTHSKQALKDSQLADSFPKASSRIESYEDCVKAGYPVLKSFPPSCATPDGKMFQQEIQRLDSEPGGKICKDLCGDQVCQEIVCLGSGCPCAESQVTCPKDCAQ